jgi:hypothetical protein
MTAVSPRARTPSPEGGFPSAAGRMAPGRTRPGIPPKASQWRQRRGAQLASVCLSVLLLQLRRRRAGRAALVLPLLPRGPNVHRRAHSRRGSSAPHPCSLHHHAGLCRRACCTPILLSRRLSQRWPLCRRPPSPPCPDAHRRPQARALAFRRPPTDTRPSQSAVTPVFCHSPLPLPQGRIPSRQPRRQPEAPLPETGSRTPRRRYSLRIPPAAPAGLRSGGAPLPHRQSRALPLSIPGWRAQGRNLLMGQAARAPQGDCGSGQTCGFARALTGSGLALGLRRSKASFIGLRSSAWLALALLFGASKLLMRNLLPAMVPTGKVLR